jgi:hypothetical protein
MSIEKERQQLSIYKESQPNNQKRKCNFIENEPNLGRFLIENSEAKESKEEIKKKDTRIKYWDIPSLWDPNYNSLYLDESLFTQDDNNKYKGDSFEDLALGRNPITEFIHNRIVELFPLGIHNIWFFAYQDSNTKQWDYSDFGSGIEISEIFDNLDINEMMKYVNELSFLCLNVIIIENVWSDVENRFCTCFQFIGFPTKMEDIRRFGILVSIFPKSGDIQDYYPEYYDRTYTYSYPFSQEQTALRKDFEEKKNSYFYSKSYFATVYNRLQEEPIMKLIHEYIHFESVRFLIERRSQELNARPKYYNRCYWYRRSYRLSFHIKSDCWESIVQEGIRVEYGIEWGYKNNSRIWIPFEKSNNINQSSSSLTISLQKQLVGSSALVTINEKRNSSLLIENNALAKLTNPYPNLSLPIENNALAKLTNPYSNLSLLIKNNASVKLTFAQQINEASNCIRKKSKELYDIYLARQTEQRARRKITNTSVGSLFTFPNEIPGQFATVNKETSTDIRDID